MTRQANPSERFYAGRRDQELRFVINDAVRIISGPSVGRTGSVVSLIALNPEPVFVVEPGSLPYGDFEASQSQLELIE